MNSIFSAKSSVSKFTRIGRLRGEVLVSRLVPIWFPLDAHSSALYTVPVQSTLPVPRPAKIRIDLDSPIPAYRQIVDALRVLLVEGSLAPGGNLPSVRRLALDLGVHFNTVGEAYRQLAAEGWLDLKHGRGATVIARGSQPAAPAGRWQDLRVQLRNLVAQMRSAGVPASRIAAELSAISESLKL